MIKYSTVLAVILLGAAVAEAVPYRATFQGQWNAQDHPTNYPGGAHFSPLIGGTHNAAVSFWDIGGLASSGIESMAEVGGTGGLTSIVNDAIADGTAAAVLAGGNSFGATSSDTVDFDVSASHPLVTLVTMVAPSPDWFTGVSGLNLLDDQEQWRNDIFIELYAHDAGTENGTDFKLSNPSTVPQEVIRKLHGPDVEDEFPFVNQGTTDPVPPLATLTFTRLATNLLGDANHDEIVSGQDLISIQRHFGTGCPAVVPILCAGDANRDGSVTGGDVIAVQENYGAVVATPAPAPVPEPLSWMLWGGAVAAMVRRPRRA